MDLRSSVCVLHWLAHRDTYLTHNPLLTCNERMYWEEMPWPIANDVSDSFWALPPSILPRCSSISNEESKSKQRIKKNNAKKVTNKMKQWKTNEWENWKLHIMHRTYGVYIQCTYIVYNISKNGIATRLNHCSRNDGQNVHEYVATVVQHEAKCSSALTQRAELRTNLLSVYNAGSMCESVTALTNWLYSVVYACARPMK